MSTGSRPNGEVADVLQLRRAFGAFAPGSPGCPSVGTTPTA